MKLDMSAIGQTKKITNVYAQDGLKLHLNNLGFQIGEEVTVISKLSSNFIVVVKNTRYGIERKVAQMIEVE